jgi:hypothetical protein
MDESRTTTNRRLLGYFVAQAGYQQTAAELQLDTKPADCHSRRYLLYPRSPRSGLGSAVPAHHQLIRPHPSRSWAHPDFTAWRFIRNAFAVLVRLGDPRVVPCFCCTFPLGMLSSTTAGNPLAVCAQFLRQRHWPSPEIERLGTPKKPHHPLQMGRTFAASLVRYSLRPAKLLATLADLTGYFSQPTVAFTSRLSTGRSPFPSLDITTVATEQVPPTGLSPAGTSASIAAPTSHSYDSFIHYTSPV